MKYLLYVFAMFLVIVTSPDAIAQNEDFTRLYHRTSALLHPKYPSNNVGAEFFPIPGRLSISGEIGFLAQGGWTEENFRNSRKYLAEIRYYIGDAKNRAFAGIVWRRRDITTVSNYVIGFDCGAGNSRDCARYEDFTGNISARLNGFQMTFGTQKIINRWLYLDAYIGIGQGNHRLNRAAINNGRLVERGRFWEEKDFGSNRVLLSYTIKFGLRIDTILEALEKDN